ncbi:MAG: DUF2269 family protein [Acidimicrobiales bacterium]
MATTGPAFEVVLAAHVVSAVVGFGSIVVTGGYAHLAGSRGDGPSEPVRRYFRPGPNLVSRLIFLVPVLGLALAGLGAADDLSQPWLWAGSGLWVLACILAEGVLWPAETRIQRLTHLPAGPGADRSELAVASRRASRSAAVIDLCFVAALVIMIGRPGGH